jgi:hypothetical protein
MRQGLSAFVALATFQYPTLESFSGACIMPAIRIPDAHRGKVRRALIAAGPISRVSQDPIYLIRPDYSCSEAKGSSPAS